MVVYKIPESNIRREWQPGETKRITFEELEQLSYQAGGKELMANFLQVVEEEDWSAYITHSESVVVDTVTDSNEPNVSGIKLKDKAKKNKALRGCHAIPSEPCFIESYGETLANQSFK